VRGILADDYTFVWQEDKVVPVDRIFRICVQFDDQEYGLSLVPPRGERLGPLKGWGTFLLGGFSRDRKYRIWRTLH